MRRVVIVILSIVIILCLYKAGQLGVEDYKDYSEAKEYHSNEFKDSVIVESKKDTNAGVVSENSLVLDYKPLEERNSDFIGWIRGNKIDLPIVHTTDNSFYLTHNFDKESCKYGNIFLDSRLSIDNDILLFHGHNTKGGLMFGSLKNYVNDKYYSSRYRDFSIALKVDDYDFKNYKVLGYIILHEEDDLLTPSDYSNEEYRGMLVDRMKLDSLGSGRVILLATCYGNAGTNKRLLLVLN